MLPVTNGHSRCAQYFHLGGAKAQSIGVKARIILRESAAKAKLLRVLRLRSSVADNNGLEKSPFAASPLSVGVSFVVVAGVHLVSRLLVIP